MGRELQLAGRMRGALRALIPAALKITQRYGVDFQPLERNGLCARCWRDWPDDPDFIPRWQRLMARDSRSTVFSGPVWQSAVVDQFVPAGKFRLITVDRGAELLAVVPLSLSSASMLETPGRWVTDYLDPLVDPDAAADCWEIILDLLGDLWDWSVAGVRIQLVRADSPARRILKSLAPKLGFEFGEKRVTTAPYISLPATWDQYLAGLDVHERKEIKRKIRNAQTKGDLRWVTLSRPDEMTPALERAMSAMRQAEPCKADFAEEILVDFLRRVCPQLSRQGEFYLHELWIEEKPTAWLLCLCSEQGPMIYNTSYDFAQRHWSPGVVAFSLAIQDAIAAGKPVFNLLRGSEEYKKRLGAKDLELFRITLLRR